MPKSLPFHCDECQKPLKVLGDYTHFLCTECGKVVYLAASEKFIVDDSSPEPVEYESQPTSDPKQVA